jgi:hypothetical protein
MRRLGFALAAVVALVAAAPSCGPSADCAKSADIQVTVSPASDVSVGSIARLHVMLSVADGPQRVLDIQPDHTITSSSAFVLRPDPAPSASYDVALTVQAFDAMNQLIAIGADSLQAVVNGCNRMTVHLAAVPVGGGGGGGGGGPTLDFSFPPGSDLAGVITMPPDMAGCIGGMPDEDTDGRANICDLCPADYDPTPTDADQDGLPDACDPDPAMKTNMQVYFDPFDVASGHWSGNNMVMSSYMIIDTGGVGTLASSNAVDMLPTQVRVQTTIFPVSVHGPNGGDTGLFIGTSANPNQGTGVFCALTSNGGPDTLDIYKVDNGSYGVPTTQSLGQTLQQTAYRLRLTQRAGNWTCEVARVDTPSNPVVLTTVQTMQTVTGPLFMTLMNDNMGSHVHSVVAETKL